jgi:hypothetical protein
MFRQSDRRGLLRTCLLAAGVLCCWPAGARAENLVFRNTCPVPVVVQAVVVYRGAIRRDKPYVLKPGDMTPSLALPGDKVITVYEATIPNRVLFQGAVASGRKDRFFDIAPDVLPGRVRLDLRRVPVVAPGP